MAPTIGELVAGVDRLGARGSEGAPMSRQRSCCPAARSPRRSSPTSSRRVAALRDAGIMPGLATILVGDDDASAGYIRIKQRQAAELGLRVAARAPARRRHPGRPARGVIAGFNDDPAVHALLIQYPMPGHLDYDAALQTDGPGQGRRRHAPAQHGPPRRSACPARCPARRPASRRCSRTTTSRSPAARSSSSGRGATLGRPLAMLLAQKRPTANAAVTVVHTGVPDWARYTRRADILVAAAGVPGIIQPGARQAGRGVIGAGVRYEGRRLLPDVDESVRRGRGRDHPAGRRRRADHGRDAVPQRGRRGRARD